MEKDNMKTELEESTSTSTPKVNAVYEEKDVKRMRIVEAEAPETVVKMGSAKSNFEKENVDYLAHRYFDVWTQILKYVVEPKDVLSVVNANPKFFNMVLGKQKAAALFPLVAPVVLKTSGAGLTSATVLTCRLVNSRTKASVEEAIGQLPYFPLWMQQPFQFDTVEKIRSFQEKLGGMSGSPFFSRFFRVSTREAECFEIAMSLIRQHGSELRHVSLLPLINHRPDQILQSLLQALSYLPNLLTLRLGFSVLERGWLGPANDEDRPVPAAPNLNDLKCLSIFVCAQRNAERLHEPYLPFIRSMLLGHQLERLTVTPFVFMQLGLDEWNTNFSNLQRFHLIYDPHRPDNTNTVLQTLAQLRWPHLHGLSLNVAVSYRSLRAIDNFRTNLIYLSWDFSGDGEDIQLENLDVAPRRNFPKLKTLSVRSFSANSGIWEVLRDRFTELTKIWLNLRLEPRRLNEIPPFPELVVRQRLFNYFPKLRQLKWTQRGGVDPAVTYTFTRESTLGSESVAHPDPSNV